VPIVVTIKVKNPYDFKALSTELKNPTELLTELQTFRRSAFFANIASGLDASGKKVAPLSEPYRTNKKKKYGQRAIRVASGNMQASYDSVVSGNKLVESMSSEIAIFHQEGTSKMPQRKLLPESWSDLSAKEQKAIKNLLTDQVDKILTKFAQSIR